MPDSDLAWLVIVPKVVGVAELHHLVKDEQDSLMDNINYFSEVLESHFRPDKLNVGALGNIVRQLHIHLICRYKSDKAWPNPVWGVKPTFDAKVLNERKLILQRHIDS